MRRILVAFIIVAATAVAAGAAFVAAGVSALAPDKDGGIAGKPPEHLWTSEGPGKADPDTRQIAPEVIAAPPATGGELVREAPRAALGPLGNARAPDPNAPPGPQKLSLRYYQLLHRPVADAAGTLQAGGHTIRLAGIEVMGADATCPAAAGGEKPCGMLARTAFRNWLRGRSIRCSVPAMPEEKEIETDCSLAGEDMASWLVANGWADAKDAAGPLATLQISATQKRYGLHGL
jgi:endonuclease YncB( thermonuclease family)